MPYIPVVGVLQAELFMTWDAQLIETVLHFEPDAAISPTLMTELGAHLVTWWDTRMKTYQPATVQINQIKLTDMSSNIAPVLNYGTGLPIVGTRAGNALPNNCALVITKRTLLRGRSYRGRIYHPGLCEADVTANAVNTAIVGELIDRYNDLMAFSTTGAAWTMQVVSRFFENAPRATGVATQVVSMDSDGRVDSQRRRLPGRGA